MAQNQLQYEALRKRFHTFTYESYSYRFGREGLKIGFIFNLDGKITFKPEINFPYLEAGFTPTSRLPGPVMDNLVFHLGMIEVVSYWKAACPGEIRIVPHRLAPEQRQWWLDLYYKGLGEFFHTNGIDARRDDFATITDRNGPVPEPFSYDTTWLSLIPVGGGKDSAVTLEIMNGYDPDWIPFVINPRKATRDVILRAGKDEFRTLKAFREMDPLLLKMNAEGYLNGHTPFSAVVAFYSLLGAVLTGRKQIILSNESSANEATIPGTEINHQYSKSYEFETAFRTYVSRWITSSADYFSLLRPLSELQIAWLFSGMPRYFEAFRSCNAGSKTDSWCGKCPKCLFTYIMLYPFLDLASLDKIFGSRLFEDPSLQHYLDELAGFTPEKPFECVGTMEEVNLALTQSFTRHSPGSHPFLLNHYQFEKGRFTGNLPSWDEFLHRFGPEHHLPAELKEELLKRLC